MADKKAYIELKSLKNLSEKKILTKFNTKLIDWTRSCVRSDNTYTVLTNSLSQEV